MNTERGQQERRNILSRAATGSDRFLHLEPGTVAKNITQVVAWAILLFALDQTYRQAPPPATSVDASVPQVRGSNRLR